MSQERRWDHEQQTERPVVGRKTATPRAEHGVNQRVDPRRTLDTQAFVSISAIPTRAYTVREISRGGMFLGFRDPRSTRQELEQYGIDRDTPVEIAFVVSTEETKNRFSVRARIRRITREGIGVAFTTHNPPQLAALRELFSQGAEDQAS